MNNFKKRKINNNIKFPCYLQPELYGIKITIYMEENEIKIIQSKNKIIIKNLDYIKNELQQFFKKYPNIYLKGILSQIGFNQIEINNIYNNLDYHNKFLKFIIYDYTNNTNNIILTNKEKINKIHNITCNLYHSWSNYSEIINNKEESEKIKKKYINMKYKGIILKNIN